VRIEFTGGAINSTGVYPAHYVTENPLFQRAIENSDAFRSGEIKRGNVEVIDDTVAAGNGGEESNRVVEVPGISNVQQARALLMNAPYNCTLAQLQNKNAIKEMALEKGITFPDWS
jgi:hypothetical protein